MLHQLENSMEIGMVHPHATYVFPLPLSTAKKEKTNKKYFIFEMSHQQTSKTFKFKCYT
jgi:hypothetical protein